MAATGLTQTEMDKLPESSGKSESHEVGSCVPEKGRSRSAVSTKKQGEKRRRTPSESPSASRRRKTQIPGEMDTPSCLAGAAAPAGAEHAQTTDGIMGNLPEFTNESQWLPPSESDTSIRLQLKQNQMLLSQLSQTVALMNTRINAMNPRCETVSHCPSSDEGSEEESQDDFLSAGDGLLNEIESELRSTTQTNTSSHDCADLFTTEEQFYEDNEPTGPAVTERVAKVVNSGWRTKVTEDMTKTVTDKYHRPQNCVNLNVPKINPELWSKLKSSTRSVDIKLQQTQCLIMKAIIPLAQLVDKISGNCEMPAGDKRSCTGLALDTMRLLCFANGNMNQRRRDLLKPDLHEQYRQLCAPSNSVTDYLLGDDLEKQVKTINEVSKVGYKMSGRPISGRPSMGAYKTRHPYKSSGKFNTNRPFLGRPLNRQMGLFNQFNSMRRKERDPKGKPGKQH